MGRRRGLLDVKQVLLLTGVGLGLQMHVQGLAGGVPTMLWQSGVVMCWPSKMQNSCRDTGPTVSDDSILPLPGATATCHGVIPTINDVPEALGIEKVTQACNLILQLPDKLVVGVLINDGIAADLLCTVSIPREGQSSEHQWEVQTTSCWASRSAAEPF